MTLSLPRAIEKSVRQLGSVGTVLGSQLPGISFFLGLTPPHFPAITLLTSGGTIALFTWVFKKKENRHHDAATGARLVATAITCAVVYGFLFQQLTVGAPPSRGGHERYQIGFALTGNARDVAEKEHLDTAEDLMLAFGGYEPGGTSRIWKEWSILVASFLLCAVFIASYVSWAFGLAYVARSLK